MNFFAHQERARRKTLWLVGFFGLAVVAIVVAVNLAVALAFGLFDGTTASFSSNTQAWFWLSLAVVAVIGGASAYRLSSLRSGGGVVAEAMGARLVPANTTDPQLRRLRNVVEEVALAAGVAVPAVYIMEDEPGINAFAAGYAPTDAAVAVTRGTLNHLSRDELQGVIAHEFSHIVNGDMRLNIRLMGILFGILVIAMIGRFLLQNSSRTRLPAQRNGRAAFVGLMLGVALLVIGYIGVFFGRLIKAAVSRQREFLADASAVQFTRQRQGIAGALKKIAALSHGSQLQAAETEEISHMLFANGLSSFSQLLATHPPLETRIRALEPRFRPAEIAELAEALARRSASAAPDLDPPSAAEQGAGVLPGLGHLPGMGAALPHAVLTGAVLADLGHVNQPQLQQAEALIATLPEPLYAAVQHPDTVVPALLVVLLGDNPAWQAQRMAHLTGRISEPARQQLAELLPSAQHLQPLQRLPLLELAVPALRQRPPAALRALMPLVEELIHLDGQVTVFEYALGRLLARQIDDILQPRKARSGGRKQLRQCRAEVITLFAVMAYHGQPDASAARQAFTAGISRLFSMDVPDYTPPTDWVAALDTALGVVDGLSVLIKQGVVEGLVSTVAYDGRVMVAEIELLRVISACLHVPLPPLLHSELRYNPHSASQ